MQPNIVLSQTRGGVSYAGHCSPGFIEAHGLRNSLCLHRCIHSTTYFVKGHVGAVVNPSQTRYPGQGASLAQGQHVETDTHSRPRYAKKRRWSMWESNHQPFFVSSLW